MTPQQQAAIQAMTDWLEDERELGRKPNKIEIAGEFDLHGMRYYLIKYKKTLFGNWLLGVCGGYEHPSDTEHCGHVFSEMTPYNPITAEQEATAMVEMIRQYWMNQAAMLEAAQPQDSQHEPQEESSGIFHGFVLLNTSECDLEQVKANLLHDWNISCSPETGEERDPGEEKEGVLVCNIDNFTLALTFVDAPVPNGEAEHFAQGNYLWPEAVDVTKTHVAQIIVAVLNSSGSALDSGRMYTKLAASCLKLPNAIGIYTSGTVFQPELFLEMANFMKTDDAFPLLNLVYFGLVRSETGMNAYTYGLKSFGKDEIEILDSRLTPSELREFLIDISTYVVEHDVTLKDGETIGFTAEQKLPITRSQGVYVDGESLKIKY
ncbi:DUF4261 domain-containing protein [Brevibacillus migulae]|uniref:DUF4261 domain-containing protein n=1 Tax=Brevibacillus migulae TaxID=1644114 RepID=UPI00106E3161|nr:DUF4261 domain-containing protein [Brevibacillus migulae]